MIKLTSSVTLAGVAGALFCATAAKADYNNVNASSNPILYWNTFVIGLPGAPPVQSRYAAMVNIAMHDAANAALGSPDKAYLSGVPSSVGDANVAAAQAAHDMLVSLNGGSKAVYDTALNNYLATIPNSSAKTAGIATGSAYAAQMNLVRAVDGSATAGSTPYTPGSGAGAWNPTPPGSLATAALPGWGQVTPFLIGNSDNFVPGGPPALDSAAYAAAFNQVKDLGALTSLTRTADQTAAALFWNNANGTSWLRIGVDVSESKSLSTLDYAQMFALLTTSVADAFIVGFDTKYTYNFWRPITAIRAGDSDGNPLTSGDTSWTSLITAPEHPSYLSTHSIASGSASTILAAFLGNQPFGINPFCEVLPGAGGDLSRCFTSFSGAAQDGANSRLWGGIHFAFDNAAGLSAGQNVANFALAQGTFRAVPEPSTWSLLLLGFAAIGLRVRRRKRGPIAQVA